MPSRYLQDALNLPLRTGESLVRLSEILSDFKGKNYRWNSGDTVLPFLKVGSLSNSFEDAYVSMAQGELSGRSNQKGTLINESVLLVSRVGDKLKPQYFQFKETPVVINPNILAFTLDQDKIGIEYLILELKSKFFTDQLNGIKRYIGIPNFSRVELKKLFIRLPAKKKDQEIKVKEQKEIYLGELEAQLKLKKEKLIGNQSQFDLVSTIKHNLSQKLAVLNNDIDYIRQTFQNSDNESINIHKPLNDLTDESVMEIITRMGQMVDDSKDTLLKTENYIRIANTENRSEKINLIEFLEKKIIPKYVGNASFRISVVYSEDDKSLAVVSGSSFLLSELFTNFIQNAINHGFVDDTRVYEICFHVTADLKSELIRILISNDGYQLPDDFTIETLLKFGERSGETSGTGIGGAVIGKILDILGGEVHIPPHTELSHSRYLVNFEVNLPLNSIKLQ
jgi:type I restriction enzyme M protein